MDLKKLGSYGPSSFLENLQLAFIILKLCGVIQWSWWHVFIPFYAYVAIKIIVEWDHK